MRNRFGMEGVRVEGEYENVARIMESDAGLKSGQNVRLSDVLTVEEERATFRCRGGGHRTKDLYSSGAGVAGVNPCSVSLYARVNKILHIL